jgi:hypothetical protein
MAMSEEEKELFRQFFEAIDKRLTAVKVLATFAGTMASRANKVLEWTQDKDLLDKAAHEVGLDIGRAKAEYEARKAQVKEEDLLTPSEAYRQYGGSQ